MMMHQQVTYVQEGLVVVADNIKKRVRQKWHTEGNLARIYEIGKVLVFYTTQDDPNFRVGQRVTYEEVNKKAPYKAVSYTDEAVPSEAYKV